MLRSLTEIKGDEALDMVADLLDPATEIMTDDDVKDAYYNESKVKAISVAIKNHKKAVKTILALVEGEDPNTYEPNVVIIPARIYQIITDPVLQDLFTLPNQNLEEATSGSVSESTEDAKK